MNWIKARFFELLNFQRIALFVRLFLSFCALIWLLAAMSIFPAQAVEKAEWIFDQRDVEGGNSRVYVTDDAVRVHNLDRGFEVLAAKPDWNVFLFRRQEKIYCIRALKDFRTFSPLGAIDIAWDRYSNLRPIAHEKRKGLPFQLAKYKSPDHHEVMMIEGLGTAPQIPYILQCYYHAAVSGIPYESFYSFSGGHRKKDSNWLNDDSIDFDGRKPWLTTSSWKKIAYNLADFQLPPGFTHINDQTKILVSNKRIESMNSIIQDIDREEHAKDMRTRRDKMLHIQQQLHH